jgi:hypothetical protein
LYPSKKLLSVLYRIAPLIGANSADVPFEITTDDVESKSIILLLEFNSS